MQINLWLFFHRKLIARQGDIKGNQHTAYSGHMDQTELMVEKHSKSPVRAIGQVLVMKFSKNTK